MSKNSYPSDREHSPEFLHKLALSELAAAELHAEAMRRRVGDVDPRDVRIAQLEVALRRVADGWVKFDYKLVIENPLRDDIQKAVDLVLKTNS